MTAAPRSHGWSSDLADTHRFPATIATGTDTALAASWGRGPARSRIASGRFRVLADLGSGSMGQVVLAEDTLLGRRVAVKWLRPELATDLRHGQRLRNEARIAALLDHPGVVRVFDLVCENGFDYIVMEYVAGPSLRTLRDSGALAIARAAHLAGQLAEALDHVHAQRIVHRDLKLENVLTTRSGRPKLNDFGIARSFECGADAGEVVGTPRAMSPEQVAGQPVDRRSDLFSLGVLLYELVAGASPFAADTHAHTMERVLVHHPRPLAAELPEVPAPFSQLVDQLLDKTPRFRPQSAREVAMRLYAIALDARAPRLR